LEAEDSRKRKRSTTTQLEVTAIDYEDEEDDEDQIVNHPTVKRLLLEKDQVISQKDNLLSIHANELQRLTNILQNIPTQAIYGVSSAIMSRPSQGHRTPGRSMV
jgi:hypothetical protein